MITNLHVLLGLKLLMACVSRDGGGEESASCVVCVGSTGAGKSSTIARVTGAEVARIFGEYRKNICSAVQARSGAGAEPVTEVCQLHRDRSGAVPWVDTVGWEDRCSDNVDTFQVGRVVTTTWRVTTCHVSSCVLRRTLSSS